MDNYYFNTNTDENGYHEVHTGSCSSLPQIQNRGYIGVFGNCKDAISSVKSQYPSYKFDGCYFCCRECHKG